jgi:hypothetical protein
MVYSVREFYYPAVCRVGVVVLKMQASLEEEYTLRRIT